MTHDAVANTNNSHYSSASLTHQEDRENRDAAAQRFSATDSPRSPLAAAISLVLGAASPAVVHAQEASRAKAHRRCLAAAARRRQSSASRPNRRRGQTLEEVTVEGQKYRSEVSSPKYTAELVDMPQTVVVIPKTVFREQAATTLTDVLRNTPGITLLVGENGNTSTRGDSIFMRGFDTTEQHLHRRRARPRRSTPRRVQYSIRWKCRRARPARTPGAATLGLRSTWSARQPTCTAAAAAIGLTYGTDDHCAAPSISTSRCSETFLGGSARAPECDVAGRRRGRPRRSRARRLGHRAVVRVRPRHRHAACLAAQILRQESTPDCGLPSAALPGLAPTTPPVGHVDQSNFYGIAGVDFDDIDSDSYTARIEHDFAPGVTLRNLSRYSDNHRLAVVTVIQNPAAFDPADRPRHARAADQRAHQPQFHEPDEPELRVPDRLAVAFDEHGRRVREGERRSVPDARAPAPRRRPTSIIRIRTTRSRASRRRAPVRSRKARQRRSQATDSTRSS